MKYKGEPNLFVRINKPRKGEVKFFTFDENGIYETKHPTTMARLDGYCERIPEFNKEAIKEVIENRDINTVVQETIAKTIAKFEENKVNLSDLSYPELQKKYNDKTGKSGVGVSKIDILKELED